MCDVRRVARLRAVQAFAERRAQPVVHLACNARVPRNRGGPVREELVHAVVARAGVN